MSIDLRFGLLGPVEASCAGRSLDLGGPTAKAVLAALLLAPNRWTSTDDLIVKVWGTAGGTTRDSVYHYISRLRTALTLEGGEVVLSGRHPGYRLAVERDAVDWFRFKDLVAHAYAAIRAGDGYPAAESLTEALAMWRGPALVGLGERLQADRRRMEDRRLTVIEELASLEVRRGYPDRAIELLADVNERLPARERCAAVLIEALDALGRRSEAGAVYRRTRDRLVKGQGIDPGPALEAAFRAALRGQQPASRPAMPAAQALPAQAQARARARAQARALPRLPLSGLPGDTIHFSGRATELDHIRRALGRSAPPGAVVICAISGMPGVGKTALAVHAAHKLADEFQDGCLFVDLHGHTRGRASAGPGEVLDRFLRRLGVPGAQIPEHAEDRSLLYRDRVAGKRLLVFLDNARDAAQVAQLLPTGPGCKVLITSRSRLTALDDARHLSLEPLHLADATALFRSIATHRRLSGRRQAEAETRIVQLCGRLPLAVRIIAARYAGNPNRSLTDLQRRLTDEDMRLSELDDGERSVATAFTLSYDAAPADQRRLFSLLALHPDGPVDLNAAAALAGAGPAATQRLADRLVDAHLLIETLTDRYSFHDLLRTFARHVAVPQLAARDRREAVQRLLDYYLCTADRADRILTPHRRRVPLAIGQPPATPVMSSYDRALGWLTTEQDNLLACCGAALEHGFDDHAWQLAFTLRGFFFLTKQWSPWTRTHQIALLAARRCGNRLAEAMTLNNLGLARLESGRLATAAAHYQRAHRLFQETGDEHGEVNALANYAGVLYCHGDHAAALRENQRALARYEQLGSHRNAAITLRSIALVEIALAHFEDAVSHLNEALHRFTELGLTLDSAITCNCLGRAHIAMGDLLRAAADHARAFGLARQCGSRYEEARAHDGLGRIDLAGENPAGACYHWKLALELFQGLGAAEAADVRTRLGDVAAARCQDAPAN